MYNIKNHKTIKNLIFGIILTFQMFVYGQTLNNLKPTEEIPIAVEKAFEEKFSGKKPIWFTRYRGELKDQLHYEGKFLIDNRTSLAVFDREGFFKALAIEIKISELPKSVRNYMKSNYPTIPIVEAILVTNSEGEISYELGMFIDNIFVIALFDKKGKFIQIVK